MYKGKKILAVIPARGGSKGIPRKNIKLLGNKPLIAWTIECAKKSALIDRTIVSTEDDEIANVAKSWGGEIPFMRPVELALDSTPGIEPILHAVVSLPGYDYVVILQVTSPFRSCEDIDGAIKKCLDANANTCVSVVEAESTPYWMYTKDDDDKLKAILKLDDKETYQRQKLPVVYQLNGAVFVCSCNYLLTMKKSMDEDTLGYLMPEERSLDIDSMKDFEIAEMMYKKISNNIV